MEVPAGEPNAWLAGTMGQGTGLQHPAAPPRQAQSVNGGKHKATSCDQRPEKQQLG